MNYSIALKKAPDTLMNILRVVMKVASEEDDSTDPFRDTPSALALVTARSYAIHMKNKIIYPIFSKIIQEALNAKESVYRKAGILLLGHISESTGCLDPIKDHFEMHI